MFNCFADVTWVCLPVCVELAEFADLVCIGYAAVLVGSLNWILLFGFGVVFWILVCCLLWVC